MKKSFLCFVQIILLLSIYACSPDSDPMDQKPDANTGNNNTKDVAVTGGVEDLTTTSAVLIGYVNLPDELKLAMGSTLKIGMEVSRDNKFENKKNRYEVNGLENNRRFTVSLSSLVPNTQYYYRTFVDNGGVAVFGETLSFTTQGIENITKTGDATDLTPSSACISMILSTNTYEGGIGLYTGVGVFYSTKKENLSIENIVGEKKGVESGYSSDYVQSNNKVTFKLKRLEQKKTYYYCSFYGINGTYALGEIKQFTTPSAFSYYVQSLKLKCIPLFGKFNVVYDIQLKREKAIIYQVSVLLSEYNSKDENGNLSDEWSLGSCPIGHLSEGDNTWKETTSVFIPTNFKSSSKPGIKPCLEVNKKYYYQLSFSIRDYETGEMCEAYDEIRNVTTRNISQKSGAVDLGLSVKWAACNLGESSPEGHYTKYSWGGVVANEKTVGDGFIGNNIGKTKYDAAHLKLGGNWRIPTYAEFVELYKLNNEICIYPGEVYGEVIYNDNYSVIFLPYLSGDYYENSDYLRYWTSNYYDGYACSWRGYSRYLNSTKDWRYTTGRHELLCIRPVCD